MRLICLQRSKKKRKKKRTRKEGNKKLKKIDQAQSYTTQSENEHNATPEIFSNPTKGGHAAIDYDKAEFIAEYTSTPI